MINKRTHRNFKLQASLHGLKLEDETEEEQLEAAAEVTKEEEELQAKASNEAILRKQMELSKNG